MIRFRKQRSRWVSPARSAAGKLDVDAEHELSPLPLRERDAGKGFGIVSVGVRGTLAAMRDASILKHAFARRLRRNQTDVERKLWYALRNRRLAQFKFRRQQPIGPYIADFFCSDAKLIVELDGSQHGEVKNREKDEIRTEFLEPRGYKVLRFWNHDLIENFDGVIETIFGAASERRRDTPHPQ